MTITRGAVRALPLLVAGLLGGCAQLLPDFGGLEEGSEQLSRVDKHSSYPAIRRSVFEQINLIELVDPHREAENLYPLAWAIAMGRMDTDRDSSFGLRYDLALAAFRERPDQAQNHKQTHRDAVQDRILSVSTSRCNVFKTICAASRPTSTTTWAPRPPSRAYWVRSFPVRRPRAIWRVRQASSRGCRPNTTATTTATWPRM